MKLSSASSLVKAIDKRGEALAAFGAAKDRGTEERMNAITKDAPKAGSGPSETAKFAPAGPGGS